MSDKQLVLAVFPDELAADNAAAALKDSGITEGDAIGILALDSDGELKQDVIRHGGACVGHRRLVRTDAARTREIATSAPSAPSQLMPVL
jgi:hypothetical protein